jgi:heme exporter protein C
VKPALLRGIGLAALATTVATVWLGLWVTPPDKVQRTLVRLLYIHPPVAWVALYLAFGLAALSSLFYVLTLVTGSLWGRPTWGVWWTWTARLTSTALLLVLFMGYLALRRVPADPAVRARRCAVAALVAFVDVPIVHFSVDWWQTLHQSASVLNPELHVKVHGSMGWTLLLGFIALTLVFVWMVALRYQVEVLRDRVGDGELEVSLAERRAEGAGDAPVGAGDPELVSEPAGGPK